MSYKHLSLEERHYIEFSMKNEKTLSEIGKELGRSQSTIIREIARNKGLRGYRHHQANCMANKRHEMKLKAIKLTPKVIAIIAGYIRQEWSPEQVVGRLEKEGVIKKVSLSRWMSANRSCAWRCLSAARRYGM